MSKIKWNKSSEILPERYERVIGLRSDGWWEPVSLSSVGWVAYDKNPNTTRDIVAWFRVDFTDESADIINVLRQIADRLDRLESKGFYEGD